MTRADDVLLTTCTDKGTSNIRHKIATRVDNEEEVENEEGLEFPELPHRRSSHVSSTNISDLQVEMEFSSKDVVAIVKWYSIKHRVNFHVTKS